ncbi:MAG: histidine kinase [Bryobacterales bacterium]|nr:histidine kinase [Bryobacterales bacterium]
MKRVRLYIFLYFTAAMTLDVVYRALDKLVWNEPPEWRRRFLDQGTGFYLAMLLLPLLFRFARRWPFRLSPSRVGIYALGAVAYSVVHTSLMWGTRTILSPLISLGPYDYGAMPLRYFMEFPSQLIGYAMWIAAYSIYQNWLRTKDLESQLITARLENLSHQLQPHFLFNALNAVSATMYEDLGRADRMLERICDFLRSALRLPESPMVSITAELALARQYLEVMKARLEERLIFEIDGDECSAAARVPALVLQPLIENAVEHGQDPESGQLDIGIGVESAGGCVKITIRDHGRGVVSRGNRAPSEGHGLANARKRLATVYGSQAALSLSNHTGGGAIVEIQLPA